MSTAMFGKERNFDITILNLWIIYKTGFIQSSFLQKDSCLNILFVCKVPRKIIEQDCWQYCSTKILSRVKALFKNKACLAAILLGIGRGFISKISKISASFWSKIPLWSTAEVKT